MGGAIKGLPVTQLPDTVFQNIIRASGVGTCKIDTNNDGKPDKKLSSYRFLEELAKDPKGHSDIWKTALLTGAAGAATNVAVTASASLAFSSMALAPPLALAAMIATPFFGANRAATIVIGNGTKGNIKISEIYQDCGVQSGRPVYEDKDPETGSVKSSKKDVIPGMQEVAPGFSMGGVGMLRFEKDLDLIIGFYGTSGAIALRCDDPNIKHTMAIGWEVPETGDHRYSATTNLGKYKSLEDFWEKTIDDDELGYGEVVSLQLNQDNIPVWMKAIAKHVPKLTKGPKILISSCERGYPEDKDDDDRVFTVTILPDTPDKEIFA